MTTTRTIEAFAIDRVKDFAMPQDAESLPIPATVLRQLLENCPVVLVNPEATAEETLPFNDARPELFGQDVDVDLTQISENHKRSFDVRTEQLPDVWYDEHGNRFSALSLKGNNYSQPGLLQHPTASEGFIAYGLQESSIIERVLKSSALLRKLAISTEHIIGVSELKSYPWPTLGGETDATELVSLKEYKRRIVDTYWKELPEDVRTMEMLGELHAKFKDMTFYVSLRATDSPYRLGDVGRLQNRTAVFDHINKYLLREGDEPLDPANIEDRKRYLRNYFCPMVGTNLARLHAAKLGHKFTHDMNLTALGGIVDLDSIYGEPLGLNDESLTTEGRRIDICGILQAIQSNMGVRPITEPDHTMALAFLDAYRAETQHLNGDIDQLQFTLRQVVDWAAHQFKDELYLNQSAPDLARAITERYHLPTRFEPVVLSFENINQQALDAAMIEFRQKVYKTNFAEDKELMRAFNSNIIDQAGAIGLLINDDFLNDIVDADQNGKSFDAYHAFVSSRDKSAGDANAYIKERAIVYLKVHLAEMLVYHVLPTVPFIDNVAPAELEAFARVEVTELIGAMNDQIEEMIGCALDENDVALREACNFHRPPTFVPGTESTSWLHSWHGDKSFGRFTEGVDFKEVTKLLAGHEADLYEWSLEAGVNTKQGGQREIFVPASRKLREVVTDAQYDFLSPLLDDDGLTVRFECMTEPTYVLAIEECEDGSLEYTLFSQHPSEENMVIDENDELQNGQPTLF